MTLLEWLLISVGLNLLLLWIVTKQAGKLLARRKPAAGPKPPVHFNCRCMVTPTRSPLNSLQRGNRNVHSQEFLSRVKTRNDAVSALENLGYPTKVAKTMVYTAIEEDPKADSNFEDLLRASLTQR